MEAATGADYKGMYEEEKALRLSLQSMLSELQITITALRHDLDGMKKMIFGSRSERFVPSQPTHPSQLTLDIVAETPAAPVVVSTQKIEYTRTVREEQKPVVHPGRAPLPEHLRREEIILEPADIPAGAKKIGEEITEELEYQPGELFVNRFVRPKYIVAVTEDGGAPRYIGAIAPMPVRPIEKSIAGPMLLAFLIIQKYIYHMPLHRLMMQLESLGVKLAPSTLCDWVGGTARLITPLYEALKTEALQSGYLHVDETRIKVLDKDKKGQSHKGWFWVYNNSPGKIVFFDYQHGRDKEGPGDILEGYKGYLQVDGYGVYDSIGQTQGITLLYCMAHARRKFVEARDNNKVLADHALEQMQVLYAIERRCKDMGAEERQTIRQREAVPVLEALGKWMKEQYVQLTPASPIARALAYSIKRWEGLSLYTTNGILHIDNNPVENSIRPVAIGRKNYMFCGSHEAAQRTAMLYSLLGTCKMNGVDPSDWLKDVLERIPTHPINKIRELLPHNWHPRQSSLASAD
jgi:transposase